MSNIIRIFISDARRLATNVVAIVVIMGLTVIPCLYAWFNIFSNWDPYGPKATGKLQVAVASSDSGTDIETFHLNIGSLVIDNLKQNKTINWQFPKDSNKAIEGVRSGKYYAALVIDKDFTANMISFLGGDPRHPAISYYENEKKNAIAPKITGKVKTTVQEEVNHAFISTLASTLVQVSNYAVSTNQKNQLTGNALLRMKQMDQDLTVLTTVLDSYMSLIDSAKSLSDASAAVTEELGKIADNGRLMVDHSSDALNQAKENTEKASDMVSASLAQIQDEVTGIQSSANQILTIIKSGNKIQSNSTTSLITAAESLRDSLNQTLTGAGFTEDQLKKVNDTIDQAIEDLKQLDQAGQKGYDKVNALSDQLTNDFVHVKDELTDLKGQYQNTVSPSLHKTMTSLQKSLNEARDLLNFPDSNVSRLSGVLSSYPDMMKFGKKGLESSKAGILELQKKLENLISDMESLSQNDQYSYLLNLIQTDPKLISDFVSSPIILKTKAEYAVTNNGSGTAPFYIVLSIWVGAIILIAIIHTKIKHPEEFPNLKNYQSYFGRYIIFFLIGQMQTLITALGALFYVRIQCLHPILFYLACALTSLTFTLLMYSLTYAMGTVGEAVCVVLMVVQVAGSGGTFPIEVLPDLYRNIYRFMPFQYSMNAVRECIGGMHGSDYRLYMLELLPFIAFSLFMGLIVSIPNKKLNAIIDKAKEETGVLE